MKKIISLFILLISTGCTTSFEDNTIIGLSPEFKRYSSTIFPKDLEVKTMQIQVFYGDEEKIKKYCSFWGKNENSIGCAIQFANRCTIFVPFPDDYIKARTRYYKVLDKNQKELVISGHELWHCIKGKFHN